MKVAPRYLFILVVAIVIQGCSQPKSAPDAPAANEGVTIEAPASHAEMSMPEAKPEAGAVEAPPAIDLNTLALKIDPVCKMSLEEFPAAATAEHEGKTYGFCSEVCKKKFVADPAKILARLAAPVPAPVQ